MKKPIIMTVIIACCLGSSAIPSLAETIPAGYHRDVLLITIHADGAYVPSDVEPYIYNSRTMVPLRAAGEALDAEVVWDNETRSINVQHGSDAMTFYIDRTTFEINGETRSTDVAPQIRDGRTMLPMRVFAEALNAEVFWNNNLRDVQIDTTAADAPAPNIPLGTHPDVATLIQKYYVAPDASDPLVGSWKHVGNDVSSTIYTYHFISPANNGTYNDIWMQYNDEAWATIKSIIVRSNTLSGSSDSLLGHNPHNSVIFSQGPNRGYDQPETYYYELDSHHQLLTATGYYISAYGESRFESLNDIYNRF